ncbi:MULTISPECIES: hypothetical protein [unclassified Streptomyces]|uniref:hypothetical protein n=1 Tax=unclassified Streptomyces TaxID=2593676 RepID=UPI002E29863E|nr:hypothetical protein [Streptomyces sp. NBC_00223]
MNTGDLMAGYAAYTTPNAVLQEMATTSATVAPDSSISISISISYSLSLSWSVSVSFVNQPVEV